MCGGGEPRTVIGMRNVRRCGAAVLALAACIGLSGCSLVEYYRGGGEQLWGHLSGGAEIDRALDELADVLREELGVESVAVESRAFGIPATARIEVVTGSPDPEHWYDVATEITTLLDHRPDLRVDVAIRDDRARVAYPLDSEAAPTRVRAVAAIAEVWGVPIDVEADPGELSEAMRVSARSDDDPAVALAFVEAAPDLRAIESELGDLIQWELPGYSGSGIARDEVLGLLVDSPLPLAPTVRYGDVEPQSTVTEYLGIMHSGRSEGGGRASAHVGLDAPDGRFEAARAWSGFVDVVRKAIARVEGELALSGSWVIGEGDDSVLVAGGIRLPADKCVAPPADPVAGLGVDDEAVAAALGRAGIPADAFSVGVYCEP